MGNGILEHSVLEPEIAAWDKYKASEKTPDDLTALAEVLGKEHPTVIHEQLQNADRYAKELSNNDWVKKF